VSPPAVRTRFTLRRELLVLVPASLVAIAALALFAVFSYRSAIERLTEERRGEAMRLARLLATRGVAGDSRAELFRDLPPGAAGALLGGRGQVLASRGFESPADALTPAVAEPAAPSALGPDAATGDRVVALLPFVRAGERLVMRLDLPSRTLAAERRALAILTPSVVGLAIALAALVLAFVRAAMRPYDELLGRARAAGQAPGESTDEVAFLVATFDRALGSLAAPPADDLGRLESTLGRELESGLVVLDREARVQAANPAALALLDLPAIAPGAGVEAAFGARPAFAAWLARAIAGARPVPRAEVELAGRGAARTLGLTFAPLAGEGGRPRGFVLLFADVTELERRAAQERLAEGLAQLGGLAAGVAHELRNGLATLAGYLGLLARRDLPATAREELAEIERETAHLERVVADFLTFAHPARRRTAAVDLAALARRVAGDPALAAVAIAVAPPESPLLAIGDEELLERALRNLVRNAVEATAQRGAAAPVEVALAAEGARAVLTVADRGEGLSPAIRERLFSPFATGKPGGVGLGLALARRIVLLHGGELEIADRPGGGTLATLRLPLGTLVTDGNRTPDDPPPADSR
jgi:signal transduction histidine kinase